ncbi:hypothetical protein TVAG_093720 [Trichomonas vaginalis G3]|uniref:Uncharacterized protein n=1 Tax=Trichomonas vaginalis (strain ATCC PRA-98 / G3) TaxID=412133 RepID=A2DBJ5_TRIV3|nr:hypothetical protein TVAGG3_0382040 [Trichomonas vaginalis G3]EAY22198.1 hypothetical protein TVAG_093720 [Trichomonas vaginalis G3]KAI5533344.1 hypothetical protein TVAGG3_0382040 [Trichomonas vaginalis G3]|eukprot:XP_001583184.1 hypothetical protein [Trichomonas vaginalis G3]
MNLETSPNLQESIDHNDPYYKKLKKLLMYRTCYKEIEKKLIAAEEENFRLKSKQYDEFTKLKQDYEIVVHENEELRSQLSDKQDNVFGNNSFSPQNKYEEIYKSLTNSLSIEQEVSTLTDSEESQMNNIEAYNQLVNKYNSLHEEFTQLFVQYIDTVNILKISNERNERLMEQLNQYDQQINELNIKLKIEKNNVKVFKQIQNKDVLDSVQLQLIEKQNDNINEELLRLSAKAEGDNYMHQQTLKDLRGQIEDLKAQNLQTQLSLRAAERKIQYYMEENEKIKSDNAKVMGQMDGMLKIQQQNVIEMKFEKGEYHNNLFNENIKQSEQIKALTAEKQKMFLDLRKLLITLFREVTFEMDWNQLLDFLSKKLNDLRNISSDRDILMQRNNKDKKLALAIENKFNEYKENVELQLKNKDKLLDEANKSLEAYAYKKPIRDFNSAVAGIVSKHFRNLSNKVGELCSIVDGKGANNIRFHALIVFSVAVGRISKKQKFDFAPQQILTYAHNANDDLIIFDRIVNSNLDLVENQKIISEIINKLTDSIRDHESEILQLQHENEMYKQSLKDSKSKNIKLQNSNQSMIPRIDYDILVHQLNDQKSSNEKLANDIEIQYKKFTRLKTKFYELKHINHELRAALKKQISISTSNNKPKKKEISYSSVPTRQFFKQREESNQDLRSLTSINVTDYKQDLQQMKNTISSPPQIIAEN